MVFDPKIAGHRDPGVQAVYAFAEDKTPGQSCDARHIDKFSPLWG